MSRFLSYSVLILSFILITLASSTMAALIPVQIDISINFQPADPIFPSLTNGVTVFGQNGTATDLGDVLIAPFLLSTTIPTINAGTTWNGSFSPGDPCDTANDLFFTIAGLSGGFDSFAFPTRTLQPTPPPIAPIIDLGAFLSATQLSASGPIFAFDQAVNVGTWGVTVTAIPEPSTMVLLGAGVVGVV